MLNQSSRSKIITTLLFSVIISLSLNVSFVGLTPNANANISNWVTTYDYNHAEVTSTKLVMMLRSQIASQKTVPRKLAFLVQDMASLSEEKLWEGEIENSSNSPVTIQAAESSLADDREIEKIEEIKPIDNPRCNSADGGCRIVNFYSPGTPVSLDAVRIKPGTVRPTQGSAAGIRLKVDF